MFDHDDRLVLPDCVSAEQAGSGPRLSRPMRYQVERPVAPTTFETNQSPCFVRTRRPDFRPADDSRLLWVGRSWASLAASSEGDPAKAHELLHAMRESFVAKGFGLVRRCGHTGLAMS